MLFQNELEYFLCIIGKFQKFFFSISENNDLRILIKLSKSEKYNLIV